jgi:hypothetical protein
MNGTNDLAQSLKELQSFFDGRQWKYCLIGGLAANRWGEVRFTRDIDLVILAELGEEEIRVDELLQAFHPRAGKRETRQFALENRVLLLKSSTGVPIDVSLGALGFEQQMLDRAKSATIVRGQKFRVASPEDMIVMKTVAGRPQDWRDIEGIIAKQGASLDWKYVATWLNPLLESLEASERSDQLDSLRRRIASTAPLGMSPKSTKKPKPSDKRKRGRRED